MAETLDRGFKSWAERSSLALRRELHLAPYDPLPAEDIVDYLGITLWTPYDVPGLPQDILDQLVSKDPWGWSAVSLQVDAKGIIIYNPRNSRGRRSSDIGHEAAHFILDHRPATIILSPPLDVAMRSFDAKQEDEANWLAWSLLLPRDALIYSKRRGLTTTQIAERYGVTETLVNFRMYKTGVNAQFRAAGARHARRRK
jgi:Zn-dependent peptidase ImmA (M78 family)